MTTTTRYKIEIQDRRPKGGAMVVIIRRGTSCIGVGACRALDSTAKRSALDSALTEVRLRRRAGQFRPNAGPHFDPVF